MSRARLVVRSAGPLVSFQDGGRPGHMRYGVPRSGPIDRVAHGAANLAVGNPAGATAIEVSLGGLSVECSVGDVTMAVAGGDFAVTLAGQPLPSWSVLTLRPGQHLSVGAGRAGSWAYLAAAGTLAAPSWLGHTATHSMSGFGGGTLIAGDRIEVVDARVDSSLEGRIAAPDIARPTGRARVVMGPQEHRFTDEALVTFRSSPYRLTPAADRMGIRLDGEPLALESALSIPSEPIVRGSVQVTGDGVPTVLLADHQTTGGYPKIATVVDADLDRLAQLRASDEIRFVPIDPAGAIEHARRHHRQVQAYFDELTGPRAGLARRLMTEDLIGDIDHD